MTYMKNIFAFLLVFLFLVSCDSKNEPILEEEIVDTSFSFVGIEYFVRDDSRGVISFYIPGVTYSNGGNIEQSFSFTPILGVIEKTSHFRIEDFESFRIVDAEVFVPVHIDESDSIFLGSRKWTYNLFQQAQISTDSSLVEIIVPANTISTTTVQLRYKIYRADYKLFLRGDKTGTIKVIEGLWTGLYLDAHQINTTQVDL